MLRWNTAFLVCFLAGASITIHSEPSHDLRWPQLKTRGGENLTCGLSSVLQWAWLRGAKVNEGLLATLPAEGAPFISMVEVKEFAARFGLNIHGYQLTLAELRREQLPAIVLVNNSHFELVDAISDKWVRAYNHGLPQLVEWANFAKEFRGRALLLDDKSRKSPAISKASNREASGSDIVQMREVIRGEVPSGSFIITNHEARPLRVTSTATTEGCSISLNQPTLIQPRQRVSVKGEVVPIIKKPARNYVEGHVVVFMEGEPRRVKVVSLVASAFSGLEISPSILDFGPTTAGESKVIQARIIGAADQGWRVSSIASDSPSIVPNLVAERDDRKYTCVVDFKLVQPPVGNLDTSVFIHLTGEGKRSIRVPVRAVVH